MTGRAFLFVHSPLVGPSSLRRLAAAASASGHEVALPDLTPMATASQPQDDYQRRAVAAGRALAPGPTIVGHSGAGAFMPAIAEGLGSDARLVFVDAVIPPLVGAHTTPEAMSRLLDEQTDDGLLRPWLTWWPAEVVARLLPDATDRDELAADMPRLPRSFYDQAVDVPSGWSDRACAYLRLSASYDAELDEAIALRWPTATLDSTHLGIHTDPTAVLAEILGLTARLG